MMLPELVQRQLLSVEEGDDLPASLNRGRRVVASLSAAGGHEKGKGDDQHERRK